MSENENICNESKFDSVTRKIVLYLFGVIGGMSLKMMTMPHGFYENIKKSKIEYINQDTLPDLILGNGEIYLQKKDGGFVSYESVLREQKTAVKDSIENKIMDLSNERKNLDLMYDAKIDSINRIYQR